MLKRLLVLQLLRLETPVHSLNSARATLMFLSAQVLPGSLLLLVHSLVSVKTALLWLSAHFALLVTR
jgi:hypothetical protein